MKTVVAEIIHVVPERREEYLDYHLHPTDKVAQIVWMHGIRNQTYFKLNDLILMTFDYVGENLREDMAKLCAYPEVGDYLIQTRRKDVPPDQLETTDWWAPLKRFGIVAMDDPTPADAKDVYPLEQNYRALQSGYMMPESKKNMNLSYDEDDWSESIHI